MKLARTGNYLNLARHGPYRIVSRDDPDVTVAKIYFPDDPLIQIHQSWVQHCPPSLTLGFYWYGTKRSKPGQPPKQILKQLAAAITEMRSPSPIRELKEIKTKDAHPDTNNVLEKTRSPLASKSTDIKWRDVVRSSNYPGSTPTKTSIPVDPTKKQQNYTDTQQSVKIYPYSLRSRSKR